MPVTVKLSRKFYEAFGDDIANELVEWFNKVDATYRGDLRELNELNFARFDAKLEQRIAELGAELRGEIVRQGADFQQRLADQRAELIKWMFIFWAGTIVPLAGLILALHKP
jgi:hypothetical protein